MSFLGSQEGWQVDRNGQKLASELRQESIAAQVEAQVERLQVMTRCM